MKKLVLLLGAVLTFTACNDDDDNSTPEISIVGEWGLMKKEILSGEDNKTVLESDELDDCKKKSTTTLKNDGEAISELYANIDGACKLTEKGNYTYLYEAESKTLVISNKENEKVNAYKVLELTNTTLQIENLVTEDHNGDNIEDKEVIYYVRK
ncbi:MAG: lipocalin family protein [Weeksellaceae bacterium]